MITMARRPWAITLLLGAFLPVLASCDDDPTEVEEEPEVASMRITVGNQVITVSDNGTVSGGPIVIPVGNSAITVAFLDAGGQPDDHVSATDFEARIVSNDPTVVTFTRASAFAGTLNGLTSGNTTLAIALFHIEEQHEDFGPFNVPVTVQ